MKERGEKVLGDGEKERGKSLERERGVKVSFKNVQRTREEERKSLFAEQQAFVG